MDALQKGRQLIASGTLLGVVETVGHWFDYALYPAVVAILGAYIGGAVMTMLSCVFSYVVIMAYNNTNQIDFTEIEWPIYAKLPLTGNFLVRSLKVTYNLLVRPVLLLVVFLLRWVVKLGKWPTYVVVTAHDPSYGYIFINGRGEKGYGLSKINWKWFVIGEFISNFIWIVLWSGAIEVIKHLFF